MKLVLHGLACLMVFQWNANGKRAKKKTKKKRSADDSDSDTGARPGRTSEPEEGEVSDSGDSSDGDDFDDGYDEDWYGDEDDRRELMAMTQLEREKILFERRERREALKTRFLLLATSLNSLDE